MKWKAVAAAAALMAAAGVGFLVYGQYQCDQLDVKIQENKAELASIQKLSLEAEDVVTESEVEMARNNISSIGNLIADKQNSLGDMVDGDERQAVFDEMKGYFSDTLLQIEWYPTSMAGGARWVFESTFDCAGNEIPVIWTLCRPGDGALLSYVCGTYLVDSDEFRNMSIRRTFVGNEALAPQVEDVAPIEEAQEEPAGIGNDMRVPAQNPDDPSLKYYEEPAGETVEEDIVTEEEPDGGIDGEVVADDGVTVVGFVRNGGGV